MLCTIKLKKIHSFVIKPLFMNYKHIKPHLNTFVIFIAIVGAAAIGGQAFIQRNSHSDRIYVTGLGSSDFKSDLGVWTGRYSVENVDLKEGYTRLQEHREAITKFLLKKGFKDEDLTFSSVSTETNYRNKYDDHGNLLDQSFLNYSLTQDVDVQSSDVDLISKISREATELINDGINISSESPSYYYTELANLKIKMLAEATKDGTTRAEQIAENANNSLGDLRSAQMGVFQITSQNGGEDYSWGGTFNTSAMYKTASVTVRLEFGVD